MLKIKKLLYLLFHFLQGCLTTNEFNNHSLNKVNLDNLILILLILLKLKISLVLNDQNMHLMIGQKMMVCQE